MIEFCDQKLKIKLDNECLPIEHLTKCIMFLDHVLWRRVVYPTLGYTATDGKIISEVLVWLPILWHKRESGALKRSFSIFVVFG